jgi:hypothetical protein
MDTPIQGSCLCGAVRFEVEGRPRSLSYCHCSRCRKQAGAFAAVVMVRREDFRLLQGAEHIRGYVPESPWTHVRAFCGTCGSPLGEPSDDYELFPIAASALDDDPRVRPVLHMHVADKPDWYEITDGVRQIPGAYGG